MVTPETYNVESYQNLRNSIVPENLRAYSCSQNAGEAAAPRRVVRPLRRQTQPPPSNKAFGDLPFQAQFSRSRMRARKYVRLLSRVLAQLPPSNVIEKQTLHHSAAYVTYHSSIGDFCTTCYRAGSSERCYSQLQASEPRARINQEGSCTRGPRQMYRETHAVSNNDILQATVRYDTGNYP